MSPAPAPAGGAPRLLLVARRFPPHSDPTSYRWLRFVTGLVARGWHVEVLTVVAEPSTTYHDEGLLASVPSAVVVHRVDPGPVDKRILRAQRRKAEAAARAAASAAAAAATPRRGPGWLARDLVRRTYETVAPMVSPDVTVEWVPWAVPAGRRLLRERAFDLVASSSSPFSSHVAAKLIVQGSGVPWVGDFSDPLADNVFIRRPGWRRAVDRALERGWLTAMDGVVVPVREMVDLFRTRYPALDPDKLHVVPYGYPEELYDTLQARPLEGFTIVHTGVFYPGPRDPMPMFRAMAEVRDLPFTLHHAGGMIPAYFEFIAANGIQPRFEYHGYVPRDEVVRLQKGAACLLAVGNQGGHQLPGKLLDYIGARRPILMLKNDAHDIAADLVTATRTGLVVDNTTAGIADGIRRMYAWWSEGTLDSRFDLGAGTEYAWAHQEQHLADVLSRYLRPRAMPARA